jgi:uncharacterized protein YndB with AHSA1/START domain
MANKNNSPMEFTISRVFDAPRDLVFQALTEVDRLAQWWGPKGFTMVRSTLDLRPGGRYHYLLRSPDGQEMWGRFSYREVEPPARLVFTNSFSDAAGHAVRAPFSSTWPLEVLNVLTLEEKDGKTTVTLRGTPHAATAEEIRTFDGHHASMQQGFGGTFDQLDDYLRKSAAPTFAPPSPGEDTSAR